MNPYGVGVWSMEYGARSTEHGVWGLAAWMESGGNTKGNARHSAPMNSLTPHPYTQQCTKELWDMDRSSRSDETPSAVGSHFAPRRTLHL